MKGIYQAKHVRIIGNTDITAHLIILDVTCIDNDNDLRAVRYLGEHLYLAVRLKARKNSRRMIIVKELAAELEIQLSAEAVYALLYLLRLHPYVFLLIKTDLTYHPYSPTVF